MRRNAAARKAASSSHAARVALFHLVTLSRLPLRRLLKIPSG
ncbi:hypothetical protein [Lysobacter gummosus]